MNHNPRAKGKMVWKRTNTSQTNRHSAIPNHKKTRLASQSSDYSLFPQTQHHFKLNTTIPAPQTQLGEWHQLKSIAKHSTIASRMELKKSVPVSFLEKSSKKSDQLDKSRANSKNKSFSRVLDANGNITTSFKESNEFRSINPHIPKDVDKIRKKTFNLYKKEKRLMDEFLGDESETMTMATNNDERVNSRAKSLMMNYNRDSEMQKISERGEYESRLNSTRMKKEGQGQNQNNNKKQEDKKDDKLGGNVIIENENEMKVWNTQEMKRGFLSKEAQKYMEDSPIKSFVKSRERSAYEPTRSKKQKLGVNQSSLKQSSNNNYQQNTQNTLLKGLLGEYSNYQKMSKHQLIEKLISLEYLAQNIFKKNKNLQEELMRIKNEQKFQELNQVDSVMEVQEFRENTFDEETAGKLIKQSKSEGVVGSIRRGNNKLLFQGDGNDKEAKWEKNNEYGNKTQLKGSSSNRNLFVIDNEDGYFNQFLESQKGKDNDQVMVQIEDSPWRQKDKQ